MHRRLTFASPVRTVSRDYRLRQGVLVFSVACVTRGRNRAAALASQLPFLIERGFCVLHAPSILLTVDARFALDQQWTAGGQLRKMIARMIVDDGDESAQRRCTAKVAVCM